MLGFSKCDVIRYRILQCYMPYSIIERNKCMFLRVIIHLVLTERFEFVLRFPSKGNALKQITNEQTLRLINIFRYTISCEMVLKKLNRYIISLSRIKKERPLITKNIQQQGVGWNAGRLAA